MLERDFKAVYQRRLAEMGWTSIQMIPGAGVPTGFPDTLFLSPHGTAEFVEWKRSPTAPLRPLQSYWIDELTKRGFSVSLVHPNNVEEWYERITTLSKSI